MFYFTQNFLYHDLSYFSILPINTEGFQGAIIPVNQKILVFFCCLALYCRFKAAPAIFFENKLRGSSLRYEKANCTFARQRCRTEDVFEPIYADCIIVIG